MEQKFLTPLSIISIFFSFTEVIAGYAVTCTAGTTQYLLTWFVVLYPVLVAGCFFAILWLEPGKFYAPTDFKSDKAYLEAQKFRLKLSAVPIETTIRKIINENLTSELLISTLREIPPGENEDRIKETMKNTAETLSKEIIDSNFFTVEMRSGLKLKITYPIDMFPDFESFTDALYHWIRQNGIGIRPFYYGTDWMLYDREGNAILNFRMLNNIPCGERFWDKRPLQEVGITAGTILELRVFVK